MNIAALFVGRLVMTALVIIGILIFTNRFTIIARTLQPYLPVY